MLIIEKVSMREEGNHIFSDRRKYQASFQAENGKYEL